MDIIVTVTAHGMLCTQTLSNLERNDSAISPDDPSTGYKMDCRIFCLSFYRTKWYFNSKKSKPIAEGEETLSLKNVQEHNVGDYYCYGTYENSKKTFLAKKTLTVYGMQSD